MPSGLASSDDDKVYALNATTGALIWNYKTGSWVVSSPAVAGSVILVGSTDSKVYAFGSPGVSPSPSPSPSPTPTPTPTPTPSPTSTPTPTSTSPIPEFPSTAVLLMLAGFTAVSVIIVKKKLARRIHS